MGGFHGILGMLGLAAMLLGGAPARAWSEHDLVTDRALDNPAMSYVRSAVPVEPLESFLEADPTGVAAVFDSFYKDLAARGSKRFQAMVFDTANPTREEFVRAARINPDTRFALVARLLPAQDPSRAVVPNAEISPYIKEVPPFHLVYEDMTDQAQSIRSVLDTFADEPDWGMDLKLWGIADYHYGAQPYGNPDGTSSQAPFHMLFLHEGFFVKTFAPELLDGMMRDRVSLWLALSKKALDDKHPYWGYRFAAWAMHYAEDLAQPYHAKAVPGKGTCYYLHYGMSGHKDQIKSDTTQLLANKHFLFEDYVAYGLMQSYLTKDLNDRILASFLAAGQATFPGVTDVDGLLAVISKKSAAHAAKIDRTVARAYPKRMTSDPSFSVETSPDYNAAATIAALDSSRGEKLLDQVGRDFESAGTAARTVLALVGAPR